MSDDNSPSNPRPPGMYDYDVSAACESRDAEGFTPITGSVRVFTPEGRGYEVSLDGEALAVRSLGANSLLVKPEVTNEVLLYATIVGRGLVPNARASTPIAWVDGVGVVGGRYSDND